MFYKERKQLTWLTILVLVIILIMMIVFQPSELEIVEKPELQIEEIADDGTKELIVEEEVEDSKYVYYDVPLEKELQEHIQDLCIQEDIGFTLALSVAWRESEFNITAKNTSNSNGTYDEGLFQINSTNHIYFAEKFNLGKVNYLNPYENATVGIMHLGDLKRRNKNKYSDEDLFVYILNCYNLGESRYNEYMEDKGGLYHREYDLDILNYKIKLEKGEI